MGQAAVTLTMILHRRILTPMTNLSPERRQLTARKFRFLLIASLLVPQASSRAALMS